MSKEIHPFKSLFDYSLELQEADFEANEQILQKMVKSNKALLSILDSLPVTFFVFSYIDLKVKFISYQKLSELFRYPLAYIQKNINEKGMYMTFELMDINDHKILTEDCFNLAIEITKDIPIEHREKIKYTNNYRILRGDGTIGKIMGQFCVSVDPNNGLPLFAIGSLTDITEHKKDNSILFKAEFYDELQGMQSYTKKFYPDLKVELSDREIEIATYISEGLKPNQIAEKLFISPFTVKAHKRNIFTKLEIHTITELSMCLTRLGII